MQLKKLMKQFNKPATRLVISDWPQLGKNGKSHGIAAFTKATVLESARLKNQKFVVLAEKNGDNEPLILQNGKVLVLRVFDKNHHSLFPTILLWLFKFNRISEVEVHSEFCADGSIRNFLLLIPFLTLIKIMRKQITYFAHNVVESFSEVAPHFNLKGPKLTFFNYSIKIYYFLIGKNVNQIVVLSDLLKKRLIHFVPEKKIVTLFMPVWQPDTKKITAASARKLLGIKKNEKVLLFFGFATWYKGVDWLVNAFNSFSQKNRNYRLIIAGGPSYSLGNKSHYLRYYKKLTEAGGKNKKITITGFIPDNKVSAYFNAADLVVFPYRTIIGASACLTQSIAYQKPFIVSSALATFVRGNAIEHGLSNQGISSEKIIFSLNESDFAKKIKANIKKSAFSKSLAEIGKQLSVSAWVQQYTAATKQTPAWSSLWTLVPLHWKKYATA